MGLKEPTPREILELSRAAEYDFRLTAYPADALRERFTEWVPYYKTKWAVAHSLQPASILEIGVRYGYSAAAFLDACPSAQYLGIDLNSEEFGGARGAIDWARRITANYSTEFIVADSQTMDRFPGTVYDLIHVDGRQDGDGSFHDLELAIHQGRFVLADGFFWTQQNFQAMSEFLFRYRGLIEYFMVIPGYAGELLIKPRVSALRISTSTKIESSEEIRDSYTNEYYLTDCGGFSDYLKTGGKKLEDDRLGTVAAVASLNQGGRVLDLGCGRGELAYYFARQGFELTAIDYSPDAIRLAEQTFANDPGLRSRVDLRCANLNKLELSGTYDVAVASDVIEHLTTMELDNLYGEVARNLAPSGIFVIHTYPNLWYFQYAYERKRRMATSLGAYLPKQPRTPFELLMHINEQSPRVLRRQLRRQFAHVLLWFGEPGNNGGSLLRAYSRHELAASRDLWAVASHRPVDANALRSRLQSMPLPSETLSNISMAINKAPAATGLEQEFVVTLAISNRSQFVLSSLQPFPVHVSYHWLHSDGQNVEVFDGIRSGIRPLLAQGTAGVFDAKVVAPSRPGRYILRLTLVQENVRWFDAPPIGLMADVFIDVLP